jgi:pimeloyl-ACP methyl ester carboxylesterase
VNVRRVSLVLAALGAALVLVARPYLDAAAFIVRAADLTDGTPARLASWRAHAVSRTDLPPIATRHGTVPARLYRPAAFSRALLLAPGVHMDGIDETRLVGMAQDLAATGYAVVTVAPPDLRQFRITPENTDVLEDAAAWMAGRPDLAPDGKVGLVGISFSGGLATVAAGRRGLRDKVAFVLSFGGHGDLIRVMRYLTSGRAPSADPGPAAADITGAEHVAVHPPHDYGVTVVLLTFADRVLPAAQVQPLRDGIGIYLRASSLTLVDRTLAEAEFARARAYAATLDEPARTLMTHVNDRAVDKLGPLLFPIVDRLDDHPSNASLSPERAAPPAAPVFLLHGADDTVIPTVESVLLARYLHGKTPVRALLSGLITHAEVDRSAAVHDVWQLTSFWRDVMRY